MYTLTNSFPYIVARVGVRMGELFARRLALYDMTLPMYRVLAGLLERPGQKLNDLSDMTAVEISTLSRLIGSMEKRKLVQRSRLPDDARSVAIHLTPDGQALVNQLLPLAQHYEKMAVAGLSAAQVQLMKQCLAGVHQNLDVLEREVDQLLKK